MMISNEMTQFLNSMEYPAHRDDLVREAARDGLRSADRARIAEITARSYHGKFDVLLELKWGRGTLLETGGSPAPAFV
jgi:hypothetical protein